MIPFRSFSVIVKISLINNIYPDNTHKIKTIKVIAKLARFNCLLRSKLILNVYRNVKIRASMLANVMYLLVFIYLSFQATNVASFLFFSYNLYIEL